MICKIIIISMLLIQVVGAQSVLDQAISNTTIEQNIKLTEIKLNELNGNSLSEIARRSNLEQTLLELKREKGRKLLMMAIEDTDMSSMNLKDSDVSHRFQKRTSDLGSKLNSIVDNTIEKSNPAIAGKKAASGRPLMLYSDVDPQDVFMARDFDKKELVVYKSTDLRGRTVYKDLQGNVADAVVQRKLFSKEEVIMMDEKGNLFKGTPKAIYPDGTLEVKTPSGMTVRRQSGAYHLSDAIKSVTNEQVNLYSGKSVPVNSLSGPEGALTEKEVKALKALKAAMCGL